jgi:hypothetical protein
VENLWKREGQVQQTHTSSFTFVQNTEYNTAELATEMNLKHTTRKTAGQTVMDEYVERGYLRGLGRAFVVHKTGTLNTVQMICLQNRSLHPPLLPPL